MFVTRVKYETHIVSSPAIDDDLNKIGFEGWSLAAVVEAADGQLHYHFSKIEHLEVIGK